MIMQRDVALYVLRVLFLEFATRNSPLLASNTNAQAIKRSLMFKMINLNYVEHAYDLACVLESQVT
jgi:hypothetical protein